MIFHSQDRNVQGFKSQFPCEKPEIWPWLQYKNKVLTLFTFFLSEVLISYEVSKKLCTYLLKEKSHGPWDYPKIWLWLLQLLQYEKLKDWFCILFFVIVIVIVIMHISNVYLLVLSKSYRINIAKVLWLRLWQEK